MAAKQGLVLLAILGACSSSPANVAGDYTVAVTEKDNGCNLQNWTVGMSYTGVDVTITQSGGNATATVNGLGGLGIAGVFGGNVFTGTVDGDHLDLKLLGTKSNNTGNCTYTYNGEIIATLTGDSLEGTLDIIGAGNGNPDCAGITGCKSFEDFNGTRPPK
jgi:hypothetical protein